LSSSLVSGNTQSCGCYGKSLKRPGNVKHLNSKTKEYNTWAALKDRCYNSKNKAFKRYGGRGIIVCDRWLESFANFLEDMGRKPTPKHSIDRIDNDGNYEPSNCRWATQDEQTNNTSRNVFFSYQGETKSLKEWSKLTSTEYSTLRIRIKKLGPEEALRISFNKQG
jgi:Fic family protein